MKVLFAYDKKLQLYTLERQVERSLEILTAFIHLCRHSPSKYQLSTGCAQAPLPGTDRGSRPQGADSPVRQVEINMRHNT